MKPLLSVVIANYNYGRFLGEAIESLLLQSCQDFEIIIIDGGTADNSVDVIKEYAKGLPPNTEREYLHSSYSSKISFWCSEPDKGQSNAFNKGFARAKGRFLTWLNADDVMLPGTIEKLKCAVDKHPDGEWFVGGCFWLDPEMHIINCGRGRPFSEIRFREGNISVWGPSSFFTKRLLESVGGVDERFHFSMDTDLWLRFAAKANARYCPFCDYAWGLRMHPDAKMSGHNFTANGELDTKHSEAEKKAASKYRQQREGETNLRLEYFTPHRATLASRIASADWLRVLYAKIDLLRFKGKHYMEYYK